VLEARSEIDVQGPGRTTWFCWPAVTP